MTEPEDVVVWDTVAPRHLAIAGRHDVLVTATGLHVPRVVLDPSDPLGERLLEHRAGDLSEIAAAERHFRYEFRESANDVDFNSAERLAALRGSTDVRVIDLTEAEADDAAVFASQAYADRLGLLTPLGRGEAAVLAVSSNREWRAGLDDGAARRAADESGVVVVTTGQWLLERVALRALSEREAALLYGQIRSNGFRGPAALGDR